MKQYKQEVADLSQEPEAVATSIKSGWCLYFGMPKRLHFVVGGHHICDNAFYLKFAKVLSALNNAANQLAFYCGVHYLENDRAVVPLVPIEAIRPSSLTTNRTDAEIARDIEKLKNAVLREMQDAIKYAALLPQMKSAGGSDADSPDHGTPHESDGSGHNNDPPTPADDADADDWDDPMAPESEGVPAPSNEPKMLRAAIGPLIQRMAKYSDACVWLPAGNPDEPVQLPKVAAAVKPLTTLRTLKIHGQVTCRIDTDTVVIDGRHIVDERPIDGSEVKHLPQDRPLTIQVVRQDKHDWTVNRVVAVQQLELF